MKYKWLFFVWCFSAGLAIAQPFNQRYILNQTAVEFDNLHYRDDTIFVFGFGTTFTPPYPAKVLFGKFDLNGNLISYDITIQDSSFTYTPYRQGSTSRRGDYVMVVGGGGMGTNPNQKGFYALYNLDTGLVWFKEFYESTSQFFLTNVCLTKDGGALLYGNPFQGGVFSPQIVQN